jgi:methyltransferase of FxLD system
MNGEADDLRKVSGEADALRKQLVDSMVENGALNTPRIVEAFRQVPRHEFVPGVPLERAYANAVVVTRQDESGAATSSSSEPGVMAVMLEQLGPEPGQRWLEIGTGTGYNAALIAWLVRPDGAVTTVDIQADVAREAQEHLASTGFSDVCVITGDGWLGAPERAPFDRIEVTASSDDLSPAWVEQLAEEGRLLLPLHLVRSQALVCFRKRGDRLLSTSVRPGSFMALQGHGGGATRWPVTLFARPWSVSLPPDLDVSVRRLAELLREAPRVSSPAALGNDVWSMLEFDPEMAPVAVYEQTGPGSRPRHLLGVIHPQGIGMAVSDADRLLAFGDPCAEERMRELAERAAATPWALEAVPADRVVTEDDARVVRRQHFAFIRTA